MEPENQSRQPLGGSNGCFQNDSVCYFLGVRTKKLGVYAGSFDPLTIGHLWMIEQGVQLFDRLVIAIGTNPDKKYVFSLEERLDMLRDSTRSFPNLSVTSFSNRFLIDFARSLGATHILRGIRSESDYE